MGVGGSGELRGELGWLGLGLELGESRRVIGGHSGVRVVSEGEGKRALAVLVEIYSAGRLYLDWFTLPVAG